MPHRSDGSYSRTAWPGQTSTVGRDEGRIPRLSPRGRAAGGRLLRGLRLDLPEEVLDGLAEGRNAHVLVSEDPLGVDDDHAGEVGDVVTLRDRPLVRGAVGPAGPGHPVVLHRLPAGRPVLVAVDAQQGEWPSP